MANGFPSREGEVYGQVSAFYLALWAHLDALSDQSRWLRAAPTASPQERATELFQRFEVLQKLGIDGRLISSLSDEFKMTLHLADECLERGVTDGALWHQVEGWKATLQSLGLEFARLESVA